MRSSLSLAHTIFLTSQVKQAYPEKETRKMLFLRYLLSWISIHSILILALLLSTYLPKLPEYISMSCIYPLTIYMDSKSDILLTQSHLVALILLIVQFPLRILLIQLEEVLHRTL